MSQVEISRRERKKDETRERITQAALELFGERGFEATTVDDIAAKADIAKGTFFNYFPRKEAVLNALAEQKILEMEEVTRGLLAARGSAREKLSRFVSEMTRRHAQSRELSRVFVLRLMANLHDPIQGLPARARGMVRALIEQGQASGELRSDVDAGRASAVIQGMAIGTLLTWLSSAPGAFELEREIQERWSLVFDGLAARKRETR